MECLVDDAVAKVAHLTVTSQCVNIWQQTIQLYSTITWRGQAIATVAFIVILGVFYIVVTVGYYIKKLWSEIKEAGFCDSLTANLRGFLIAFGFFSYYLGDNISRVTEYEICTGDCAETDQIVGVVMLGAATVTYLLLDMCTLCRHNLKHNRQLLA